MTCFSIYENIIECNNICHTFYGIETNDNIQKMIPSDENKICQNI